MVKFSSFRISLENKNISILSNHRKLSLLPDSGTTDQYGKKAFPTDSLQLARPLSHGGTPKRYLD